ncbi:MAG: B12-binding domain-containing protein [Beijerinckiaceae bacterium]
MANLDARKLAPSRGADVDSKAGETNSPAQGDTAVARVFRSLILPELKRGAQETAHGELRGAEAALTDADTTAFCDLLTHGDFAQAMEFMNAALGRGVDYDTILMELLAGAARQLGLNWERDECGFGDVTVGMSRLHQVLQQLAMSAPFNPAQLQTRGRALLAPSPGEQHNFGIMMLDHFFHRAGWELRTIPGSTDGQLARITADSRFDVVGLSLSCDEHLPRLERAISMIRRESRNQSVVILVGGRVFTDDASLAIKIGADAAPPSAPAALVAAEVLMDARRQPSFARDLASG